MVNQGWHRLQPGESGGCFSRSTQDGQLRAATQQVENGAISGGNAALAEVKKNMRLVTVYVDRAVNFVYICAGCGCKVPEAEAVVHDGGQPFRASYCETCARMLDAGVPVARVNCGHCLEERIEIVPLASDGSCLTCGRKSLRLEPAPTF